MQKEEIISLVIQMYDELIDNVNTDNKPSKEQILTFLENASSTISHIPDSKLDSIEHAKLAFSTTYKEIVDESLTSYKLTNNTFEELTQVHQETIDECHKEHIDLTNISKKFNDIQSQMTQEIKRANEVITNLNMKVKKLEENSNLDALTKVFNRRALTTYLSTICSKQELPHELYLLILDIDDFKKINDTYGHVAGDKILIYIANMLRKTLRDGDKVFRYGGEEFVIVLNRVDKDKCLEITNRLLNLIRNNRLIYKGSSLQVTMSMGVTQYYNGDLPDDLISRADRALYKSKNAGKNQMNTEFTNGN